MDGATVADIVTGLKVVASVALVSGGALGLFVGFAFGCWFMERFEL